MKENIIAKIVDMELKMFDKVANIGGRARCQNNPGTFKEMRSSQTKAWPEDVLNSYLKDLEEAEAQGKNLLTEKYARMMKFTFPSEYAEIKNRLSPITEEQLLLIDEIVKIHMEWTAELDAKFPYIRQQGRPATACADTAHAASVETYLRGELATYSLRTLSLYYQDVMKKKSEDINASQIVLEDMVQKKGFHSLEEANNAIKQKMMKECSQL